MLEYVDILAASTPAVVLEDVVGVTSSASIAAAQSTTLRRPSASRCAFFIAENLVIHDLPFLRDDTPSMVPFRKMTSKRNGSVQHDYQLSAFLRMVSRQHYYVWCVLLCFSEPPLKTAVSFFF